MLPNILKSNNNKSAYPTHVKVKHQLSKSPLSLSLGFPLLEVTKNVGTASIPLLWIPLP